MKQNITEIGYVLEEFKPQALILGGAILSLITHDYKWLMCVNIVECIPNVSLTHRAGD